MDIAIFSFEYGAGTGPEGVVTERLTKALSIRGYSITVFTASEAVTPYDYADVRQVKSRFSRPTKLMTYLGNALLRGPIPNWYWAHQASRVHVDPDVVYARANPLTSFAPALSIAHETSKPLWLHLSDPIPSPWEKPEDTATVRRLKYVAAALERADRVTVTVEECADYLVHIYGSDIRAKIDIVRNIVPDEFFERSLLPLERVKPAISYVGNFGGRRTPDPLIGAIAEYGRHAAHTPFELHLVGTSSRWVSYIRERIGLQVCVKAFSRSFDVLRVYENSMISLVIDADDATPVFLATKTAEAIVAGRCVLVISPIGSPARRIFDRGWESVRFCLPTQLESIWNSLLELSQIPADIIDLEIHERRCVSKIFASSSVVSSFAASAQTKCLKF